MKESSVAGNGPSLSAVTSIAPIVSLVIVARANGVSRTFCFLPLIDCWLNLLGSLAFGPVLNHSQLPGQLSGAKEDRHVVCVLDGEAAGDLPAAAQDRLTDDRRRQNAVVEHDGKGLSNVLL